MNTKKILRESKLEDNLGHKTKKPKLANALTRGLIPEENRRQEGDIPMSVIDESIQDEKMTEDIDHKPKKSSNIIQAPSLGHRWLDSYTRSEPDIATLHDDGSVRGVPIERPPVITQPVDDEMEETRQGEEFLMSLQQDHQTLHFENESATIAEEEGEAYIMFGKYVTKECQVTTLRILEVVDQYCKSKGIFIPRLLVKKVESDPSAVSLSPHFSPDSPKEPKKSTIGGTQRQPSQPDRPGTPVPDSNSVAMVRCIKEGVYLKSKSEGGPRHKIDLSSLAMSEEEIVSLYHQMKPANLKEFVKYCLVFRGQFKIIARRYDLSSVSTQ
ncbi:polymerase-associated protein [Drosophila ananassae sigmavirus]|uniref:Polymerase-associated protein n=1 Tax=Drosophila ananassae sigmavirus TaxID=1002359 RepID=A0A140D8K6_9RHAB|nr:polymerase-associated protein [Drosophila ananassae sigmavirus]AMK09230.1 polymerase-associated protein [Drosophila ananassae sigmavirus]